jgi:hypothetical protein
MQPILKNILAVISGLIVGSIVNGSLISISGSFIPPPEGTDISNMEGLKAAIPLFEPKHFLFPFLAHALGTIVGAFLAAKIAPKYGFQLAIGVGFFFLAGGITNIFLLPSPIWFSIMDLVGAYIPMAFLGWTLTKKKHRSTENQIPT